MENSDNIHWIFLVTRRVYPYFVDKYFVVLSVPFLLKVRKGDFLKGLIRTDYATWSLFLVPLLLDLLLLNVILLLPYSLKILSNLKGLSNIYMLDLYSCMKCECFIINIKSLFLEYSIFITEEF